MPEKEEKLRGEAKEKMGQAMGDDELERQGRVDQSKADLKDAGEQAKTGLTDAAEQAKETVEKAAEKAKGAFDN